LLFLLITAFSPAGNASAKTDTMKKYFDSHKTSKKTGVAGQVQKIVISRRTTDQRALRPLRCTFLKS
jgi:hypothetical protein